MKLYKITDNGPEVKTFYEGTQTDARKKRIEREAAYKDLKKSLRPEVTVEEIEVPTDKKGLIEYLNKLVGA